MEQDFHAERFKEFLREVCPVQDKLAGMRHFVCSFFIKVNFISKSFLLYYVWGKVNFSWNNQLYPQWAFLFEAFQFVITCLFLPLQLIISVSFFFYFLFFLLCFNFYADVYLDILCVVPPNNILGSRGSLCGAH